MADELSLDDVLGSFNDTGGDDPGSLNASGGTAPVYYEQTYACKLWGIGCVDDNTISPIKAEIGGTVGGNNNIGNLNATGGNTTGGSYTVKSGDTLGEIASSHGLTLAQVKALNPQITNVNNINVGQQINLGGGGVANISMVPVVGVNATGGLIVGKTPVVNTGNNNSNVSTAPATTGNNTSTAPKANSFTAWTQAHGISIGALLGLGVLGFAVIMKGRD